MTIRRADERDRPALLRMAVRFIQETGYQAHTAVNLEQLGALVDYLLIAGAVWVLVDEAHDGAVVGMLGVALITHSISGLQTASEVAWWIDPEVRGGSAAVRMLAVAEAWALEVGAVQFQMIAPVASPVAALYRRRGFREVETVFQRQLVAA